MAPSVPTAPTAPAAPVVPDDPVVLAAPAASVALAAMKCNTCGQLGHRRTTHKNCLANRRLQPNAASTTTLDTASAALAAPAVLGAPVDPVAFAAPAAPAEQLPRVFGNGMAAINEQDNSEYRTLGRMNVACSHCGALHWIEVMISVIILFTIILYLSLY